MSKNIMLVPGWWCWLEVPVTSPGFGASPIFVQHVEPLKTGKGLLRLSFIQAIHSGIARERQVVLRVQTRTDRHLVGTLKDDGGAIHTAILTAPDYGWLETYCPLLLRRRPPSDPTFFIAGQPLPPGSVVTEYLDATFGRTPAQLMRGATAVSFGQDHPPLPARHSFFILNQTYSPFDSWMIARGFVPAVMEEKWFVYMENGRLLFRRSWTGFLIYDIEATWRGGQLYLGQVRVNRDPEQYSETDDDHDRQLLNYLIVAVLLGEHATFPTQNQTTPEQAAIQAWALAGNASL